MLIGEDCSCTLTIGAAGFTGSIKGKARRITMEDTCETTNTKALGDGRKKFRTHSGQTQIDIEQLVGYTGYAFISTGGSPIGSSCEVTVSPLSSLVTPQIFLGVITKWKGEIVSTEAQMESISILCDADPPPA